MKFFRNLMPSNANRLKENNLNLDFSYITPRVTAMSYPSSNAFEQIYHNDINEVSMYINSKHPKHYSIYNLSGIEYDYNKFDNSVITYVWEDHHSPPLNEIFQILKSVYDYLEKNDDNIVNIHCLGGKGRTGSTICSLLLFSKLVKNSKEAMDYFSIKRFKKLDKGVQQPSQVRCVKYVERILHDTNFELKNIAFEINLIKIKNKTSDIDYIYQTAYDKDNEKIYTPNNKLLMIGDITISLTGKNLLGKKSIFGWVCFNTLFLDENKKCIEFEIEEIDPHKLKKNKAYSNLVVSVNYNVYHPAPQLINPKDQNYNYRRIKCEEIMQLEQQKINCINYVRNYYYNNVTKENSKKFLFGNKENDIEKVLKENNSYLWNDKKTFSEPNWNNNINKNNNTNNNYIQYNKTYNPNIQNNNIQSNYQINNPYNYNQMILLNN